MRFLLAPILILCACSETSFQGKASDPKPAPAPAPNGQNSGGQNTNGQNPGGDPNYQGSSNQQVAPAESELVTPPQPITGILLRCASIFTASEQVPIAMIGCRHELPDGSRVNPVASRIRYEFSISGSADVIYKQLVGGENFDAQFEIKAASFELSNAAARDAKVESRAISLDNNQILAQLARLPANELSPGSNGPRGKWSTNGTFYRDAFSNLAWSKDDQQTYTQDEGRSRCENLNLYGAKWRLPSILEMSIAWDSGLGTVYAGPLDMGIASQKAFAYWTSSTATNGLGIVKVLASTESFGLIASTPADVKHAVLCITE